MPPIHLTLLHWIYFFAAALAVGSFLNVVIHRVPKGLSVVAPRSRCPSCQTQLPAYDNIPVLSYLWLRGRCRTCRTPIGWIYPAVELLTACLACVVLWHFGPRPMVLPYLLMTFILVAVTFIDLELQIIPDRITLPFTALFLLLALAGHYFPAMDWPIPPLKSLLGALTGWGIVFGIITAYYWMTGKFGMGGGDMKLLALLGALIGPLGVGITLVLASFLGTVMMLPMMLAGKAGRETAIPFGPFLAGAAFITMLYGPQLIELYSRAMGFPR